MSNLLTQWHKALEQEDMFVFANLIAERTFSATSHEIQLLLIEASKLNNATAARYLLKAGVDVNVRDLFESSALHYAAENGNEDVVQLLLDYNANPFFRDAAGDDAIYLAVDNGHLRIAEIIADYSSSQNKPVE